MTPQDEKSDPSSTDEELTMYTYPPNWFTDIYGWRAVNVLNNKLEELKVLTIV